MRAHTHTQSAMGYERVCLGMPDRLGTVCAYSMYYWKPVACVVLRIFARKYRINECLSV